MENEIYVAHQVADTFRKLPKDQQDQVAALIDSLDGNGWKNGQIVAPDGSQGGGLRAVHSGNLSLLFRYAPEEHAIIVAGVTALEARDLATAS